MITTNDFTWHNAYAENYPVFNSKVINDNIILLNRSYMNTWFNRHPFYPSKFSFYFYSVNGENGMSIAIQFQLESSTNINLYAWRIVNHIETSYFYIYNR